VVLGVVFVGVLQVGVAMQVFVDQVRTDQQVVVFQNLGR
jgi:hypothetical protein